MTEPCTNWEVDRTWVCQDPDVPREGCEIGCLPCDDFGPKLVHYAVSDLGRRWMRPDEERTHRDAHGRATILRSNSPIQVPRFINYKLAPCWTNGQVDPPEWGQENFNGDVCDCFPGPSTEPEELPGNIVRCEGGESVGELLHGWIPDCAHFQGYHWGASSLWMSCRTVLNRDVDTIPIRAERLFQAMFVRTAPCTSNMMVPCAGRVPGARGCEPWWDPDLPPPDYYNPDYQRFNYVGLDTDLDPPTVLNEPAKTAVLATALNEVFADTRFDRLDYAHAGSSSNHALDWWDRSYDGTNQPLGDLIVVPDIDLSGSRMLYSREPVLAELVIRKIHAGMSLVAHRVCHRDTYFNGGFVRGFVQCEYETYPHVRFRIQIECAVRLEQAGDYVLADAPEAGQILYFDGQGREVTPPDRVQWLGYLGHYSDPPIQNVAEDHDYPHNIEGECHGFADTLEGIVVPAWPYRHDSHPEAPNQVYGGSIRLYWPNN